MKRLLSPIRRIAGLLLASLALSVRGSDAQRTRWHLEAGPALWLNARVAFGATAVQDPALTAPADRNYDDGFNRIDASGNLGDGTGAGAVLSSRTGNWGFVSPQQVNLSAGTLSLHLTQPLGEYLGGHRPAQRPGFDWALRLSLADPDDHRDWGLEIGVDFNRLNYSVTGPQNAALRVLTDTYQLGGVVPQQAPYSGHFAPIPGDQRIGDIPTRTTAAAAGTASGLHALKARATVIRFGGWIEVLRASLTPPQRERDRWSLLARGGPAYYRTKANLQVDEVLQAPGLAATPRFTASATRSRDVLGWFAGLRARRTLGEHWAAQVWADALSGSRLTVASGTRYARLDTRSSALVGLALEYRGDNRRK